MIVVTGPTGQIGSRVLATLLASGEPIRVIARDPARVPDHVRERVEIVKGSHGDAGVVDEAFTGADTVFWLLAADRRAESLEAAYLDFTRPACEAIEKQGVSRVVGISALGRGLAENAGYLSASHAMDDLIAGTGVAYRALTMPTFMDNLLWQAGPIGKDGVFFGPLPADLEAPMCATRDIAAVAAKWLLDRSWHGVADVPVLGPEDLSQNALAEIMSDVLGRTVRYRQVSIEDFRATQLGQGWSEPMAQGMVDMMLAKEAGIDNAEPRTPEATTPTTFRQWCEEVLKPAVGPVR
ncbi:NmrA family transcriptional regulator [Amycolatopsis sp. WAC 04182]|uniref:NAD(P)H-binding protein n=1 Tax=Amycolatopsis sp. WAC 04182 TaxID=2203198 RepID=UPI000F7B4E2C|nr:NAD(P)H-binding protein [Amycolatopsis sp. WAC 04182]RSN55263.1 NmrA family transcriptional regulator [Amycolatopsis sp. WAC 04182]